MTGTIPGTFAVGTQYTETISNTTDSDIVNGRQVSVSVAECNDAGKCSTFVAAPNAVIPYGPIPTPVVTANQNGTSINYTWSEQPDGLTETLNVCITNNGCANYAVSATGGYNGQTSVPYGYSTTGTITAYATDTAGQRAPQTGTVTAAATTVAAPPPPVSVTVAKGNVVHATSGTCAQLTDCYNFYVTVANFTAGATLTYTCSDNIGAYWTASKAWNGTTVKANNPFYTQCVHAPDGENVTISVTDGTHSASGSYKT